MRGRGRVWNDRLRPLQTGRSYFHYHFSQLSDQKVKEKCEIDKIEEKESEFQLRFYKARFFFLVLLFWYNLIGSAESFQLTL